MTGRHVAANCCGVESLHELFDRHAPRKDPNMTDPEGSASYHVGRSWTGTELEDTCPCPKVPCGLVDQFDTSPDCDQHPPERTKSMRQGHSAEQCPGVAR